MTSQLTHTSCPMLCSYENGTSSLQMIRIVNSPGWYFERVIFPGQRFLFEAPVSAELEVHTPQFGQTVLARIVPCDRLQVRQTSSYPSMQQVV